MTPKEAAAVIGCDYSHVRRLIRDGKLKASKRSNPFGGFYYNVTPAEARRYRDTKQLKGFPRGKKRS